MEKTALTPQDRLFQIRDWLLENDPACNNETAVQNRLGLGPGFFGTAKQNKYQTLRDSTYDKIKKACPEVNLNWIRTGEGEMFNEPVIMKDEPVGIPYYDVDFLGGFSEMVNDQTMVPAYFIDFLPYNKKNNIWCNIFGDSMSPRINSGDKICIQPINNVEDIVFGEIYAIITKSDLRTVKWVTRSPEKDMIRLVPENKDPRYGDYQDIAKRDIRFIYKVVGTIHSF